MEEVRVDKDVQKLYIYNSYILPYHLSSISFFKIFLSKCYYKFQPEGSYNFCSFMRVSTVANLLVAFFDRKGVRAKPPAWSSEDLNPKKANDVISKEITETKDADLSAVKIPDVDDLRQVLRNSTSSPQMVRRKVVRHASSIEVNGIAHPLQMVNLDFFHLVFILLSKLQSIEENSSLIHPPVTTPQGIENTAGKIPKLQIFDGDHKSHGGEEHFCFAV